MHFEIFVSLHKLDYVFGILQLITIYLDLVIIYEWFYHIFFLFSCTL